MESVARRSQKSPASGTFSMVTSTPQERGYKKPKLWTSSAAESSASRRSSSSGALRLDSGSPPASAPRNWCRKVFMGALPSMARTAGRAAGLAISAVAAARCAAARCPGVLVGRDGYGGGFGMNGGPSHDLWQAA